MYTDFKILQGKYLLFFSAYRVFRHAGMDVSYPKPPSTPFTGKLYSYRRPGALIYNECPFIAK